MVSSEAMVRFKGLVEHLHGLTGAAAQVERRVNDAIRHVGDLRAERARIATPRYRDAGFGARLVVVDVDDELAALDLQISTVASDLARLRGEHARLQHRRDDANTIACRCRDYLRERGVLPRRVGVLMDIARKVKDQLAAVQRALSQARDRRRGNPPHDRRSTAGA